MTKLDTKTISTNDNSDSPSAESDAVADAAQAAWFADLGTMSEKQLPTNDGSASAELHAMLRGFTLDFSINCPSTNYAATLDGILGDKQEKKLANGVGIKSLGNGDYEVRLSPFGDAMKIDTKNGTARYGKQEYTVGTDTDGSLTLKPVKPGGTEYKIAKDGSVTSTREDADEKTVRERPVHGKYEKVTHTDKETGKTTETFEKVQSGFKTEDGHEVKFEPNGTREGKTTITKPDGTTITLEHQTVTVTAKDGTTTTYGPKDGKTLKVPGETRSDWYVELPGGIIANFGHNGASGLAITDTKGNGLKVKYGEGSPSIVVDRK